MFLMECDYEKDYMKIKFNSDDDVPLNKVLIDVNKTNLSRKCDIFHY